MDPLAPAPDARTLARRRLLRGSFAAPAVLTMASGSALAQTSVTCLAKATASPSTAPLATSIDSDTFVRVQLLVRTNNQGQLVHLVTRASFGSVPVSTSFWNSGTLWQRVRVSGANRNQTYGNQQTNAVPGDATASNYWIALRFDAAGNIVGLGASGTGSVVGGSCWGSLMMPAPPP